MNKTERFIKNTIDMGIEIPMENGIYACTVQKQGKDKKFGSVKSQYLGEIGIDIANTLTARYYKGPDAPADNVVLEVTDDQGN